MSLESWDESAPAPAPPPSRSRRRRTGTTANAPAPPPVAAATLYPPAARRLMPRAAFRRGLGHGALAAPRGRRETSSGGALLRGVVGARLGDDARAGAAVGLVGAGLSGPPTTGGSSSDESGDAGPIPPRARRGCRRRTRSRRAGARAPTPTSRSTRKASRS